MCTTDDDDDNNNNNIREHLDWSHKQSRILTANNTATLLYTPERGYPFHPHELPHYHLVNNTTHTLRRSTTTTTTSPPPPTPGTIIVGAWTRPLFVGQWELSTSQSERVFNIQTSQLFIDLRIPTTKPRQDHDGDLRRRTPHEFRCDARQHVFGGITDITCDNDQRLPLATRHHFIDWNYVGLGRSRPNKWFVEMKDEGDKRGDVWKEWSFAKDDYGQSYYWERWERLVGGRGGDDGVVVAMRKRKNGRDGIVVIVGDHFNYLHDRVFTGKETKYDNVSSLVDLVDTAVSQGDFETAESYLSMDGGHGRVSSGWIIDTSTQSWMEGLALFTPDSVKIMGGDGLVDKSCYVLWHGEKWDIWESSLASVKELEMFLKFGKVNNNSVYKCFVQ